LLFHLQRHSYHHANLIIRYQSLWYFTDLPSLPSGYYGLYVVAYLPALWFKMMDSRLLALPHINGDLSKININPDSLDAIQARYGQADA